MPSSHRARIAALTAAVGAAVAAGVVGTTAAAETANCGNVTYQVAAHAVLDPDLSYPHDLDGGRADVRACESLRHRPAGTAGTVGDEDVETPRTTPHVPTAAAAVVARPCSAPTGWTATRSRVARPTTSTATPKGPSCA